MTNEELPNDTISNDPFDDVSDDSQLLVNDSDDPSMYKIICAIILCVILIWILSRWS